MYKETDEEKNRLLRKLRNKIGYGMGWRFKDALNDLLAPYIAFAVILILFLLLASHMKISWVW